jgi:hypothetical protein
VYGAERRSAARGDQVRGLRPLKNPARLFSQISKAKLTDTSLFLGGYGGLAPHQ